MENKIKIIMSDSNNGEDIRFTTVNFNELHFIDVSDEGIHITYNDDTEEFPLPSKRKKEAIEMVSEWILNDNNAILDLCLQE